MKDLAVTETISKAAPRNTPQQERSRRRKELLLDAVEEIVQKTGLDGLGMREVARTAGLPIASVYHYFPAKTAMIRELAVRRFEEIRAIMARELASVEAAAPADMAASVAGLIDAVSRYFVERPSIAAILRATHADPELRHLDEEDSARNTALMVPLIRALLPQAEASRAPAVARVLLEATVASLLLAIETPSATDRADIVDALKTVLMMTVRGGAARTGRAR